ncbi:MAG: UDP-glucose 4-epimerase family protein [Steroidobacteraceae bacterium]
MKRILLTGSTGFLGSALIRRFCFDGLFALRAAYRNEFRNCPDNIEAVRIGDLGPDTDWNNATEKIDIVIHTAGRAHIPQADTADRLNEYRKVNVDGSLSLARQAAADGVKRFIYISTIKVNGESTLPDCPYTPDSTPAPIDPYGISKYEAEEGLLRLSRNTGMELTIIRPPLIYGPGVRANFLQLLYAIAKGIPLPLNSIRNRRSMIALDNLVDLIVTCADHPAAANQIILVSDGEDLSTPDLIRRIARPMGRPVRLYPVPPSFLYAGAYLLGKRNVAQRLCGSLQVDIRKTRELMAWKPPISVDDGLASVVHWFIDRKDLKSPS